MAPTKAVQNTAGSVRLASSLSSIIRDREFVEFNWFPKSNLLLSRRESRPLGAGKGTQLNVPITLKPANSYSPVAHASKPIDAAESSRPEASKRTHWQARQFAPLPRLFTGFSHRKTSTHHCPKPRGLVRLPVSRCTGAPSIDQDPSTGRQILAMYSELKWSS
jgi:hypothetical protein